MTLPVVKGLIKPHIKAHMISGPWYATLSEGLFPGVVFYSGPSSLVVTLDRLAVSPSDGYSLYRVDPHQAPQPTAATQTFLDTPPFGQTIAPPETIDLEERAQCSLYSCQSVTVVGLVERFGLGGRVC